MPEEITNTDFFGKFTVNVRTTSYTPPSANGYKAEIDVIYTATGQVLKHLSGMDMVHMYGEEERGHRNVKVVESSDNGAVTYHIEAALIKSGKTETFPMPKLTSAAVASAAAPKTAAGHRK